MRHGRLSALQRFVQQVFDGFAVKYLASAVALLLYAAPLYLRDPAARGSRDDITQDYIRSMRLLQNTSRRARACASLPPQAAAPDPSRPCGALAGCASWQCGTWESALACANGTLLPRAACSSATWP